MRIFLMLVVSLLSGCGSYIRPTTTPPQDIQAAIQATHDEIWRHHGWGRRDYLREFGYNHPGWRLDAMSERQEGLMVPQTICTRAYYILTRDLPGTSDAEGWGVVACDKLPLYIVPWPPPPIYPIRPAHHCP